MAEQQDLFTAKQKKERVQVLLPRWVYEHFKAEALSRGESVGIYLQQLLVSRAEQDQ